MKEIVFLETKEKPTKYWTLLFGNDEIDINENDKVGAEIRKNTNMLSSGPSSGLHQHQLYIPCSILSMVVYVLDLLTLLYMYDLW